MNALAQSLAEIPRVIESLTSYASALAAAIIRHGDFTISADPFNKDAEPKITFKRLPSHEVDYARTGRHALVFEMEGTGKTYEVSITPIKATHGG